MKDLYHDFRSTYVIAPQTLTTANANGTGTDLLGYRGALMIVHLGAVGANQGGSNNCTIGFFESTNNSVFSAIADTDLIGGNNTAAITANASANATIQRSYIGSARYVTIRIAVAGTISLPVSGEVVKGFPLHAPIA
jgi:hypothetical protein